MEHAIISCVYEEGFAEETVQVFACLAAGGGFLRFCRGVGRGIGGEGCHGCMRGGWRGQVGLGIGKWGIDNVDAKILQL